MYSLGDSSIHGNKSKEVVLSIDICNWLKLNVFSVIVKRTKSPCPWQQTRKQICVLRTKSPCPRQQTRKQICVLRTKSPCPWQQTRKQICVLRTKSPCPWQQTRKQICVLRTKSPCPRQQTRKQTCAVCSQTEQFCIHDSSYSSRGRTLVSLQCIHI